MLPLRGLVGVALFGDMVTASQRAKAELRLEAHAQMRADKATRTCERNEWLICAIHTAWRCAR